MAEAASSAAVHARFRLIPDVHLSLQVHGRILLPPRFNAGCVDGNDSVVAGHVDRQGTLFNLEPHKCSDPSWCDQPALPGNMVTCVHHAIDAIGRDPPCSAFGWNDGAAAARLPG